MKNRNYCLMVGLNCNKEKCKKCKHNNHKKSGLGNGHFTDTDHDHGKISKTMRTYMEWCEIVKNDKKLQ